MYFLFFFLEFFAFIDFNLQIASGTAEWCFVSHSKGITTSSPFPYFHSTAVHHVYVAAVQPAVHHHLEAAYLPHLYTASNSWELDARWCNKWTKRYEVTLMYIYTHKGLNLYLNWIIIILIACLLDIWSIELIWLAFLFDGLIFFLVYPYLCLLLFVLSACVDLDFICNAFFCGSLSCAWCLVVVLSGSVARWFGDSVAWWLGGLVALWRLAYVTRESAAMSDDRLATGDCCKSKRFAGSAGFASKTCPGSQFVRRPGKPLDYVIYLFSHAR